MSLGGTRKQGSGEDYKTRSLLSVLHTKYYSGGQIKNEMGGACGIYMGEETHIVFWLENLRERDPLGRHRRRWEDNIKIDLIFMDPCNVV